MDSLIRIIGIARVLFFGGGGYGRTFVLLVRDADADVEAMAGCPYALVSSHLALPRA